MCSKLQSISPNPSWMPSPKYTSTIIVPFSQPTSGRFWNLSNGPGLRSRFLRPAIQRRSADTELRSHPTLIKAVERIGTNCPVSQLYAVKLLSERPGSDAILPLGGIGFLVDIDSGIESGRISVNQVADRDSVEPVEVPLAAAASANVNKVSNFTRAVMPLLR